MPKRKSRMFDSPLIIGVSAVLVVLVINAVAFNVPLVPVTSANGQTVALNVGAAGIPLIAILGMLLLFVRRMNK